MNLLKSLNNYSKQIYNYFFNYNINKLTTFAQDPSKIIRILEHALFHKEYILLTYQNGCTEIGQLIKRTSAGRFVLDKDEITDLGKIPAAKKIWDQSED